MLVTVVVAATVSFVVTSLVERGRFFRPRRGAVERIEAQAMFAAWRSNQIARQAIEDMLDEAQRDRPWRPDGPT